MDSRDTVNGVPHHCVVSLALYYVLLCKLLCKAYRQGQGSNEPTRQEGSYSIQLVLASALLKYRRLRKQQADVLLCAQVSPPKRPRCPDQSSNGAQAGVPRVLSSCGQPQAAARAPLVPCANRAPVGRGLAAPSARFLANATKVRRKETI